MPDNKNKNQNQSQNQSQDKPEKDPMGAEQRLPQKGPQSGKLEDEDHSDLVDEDIDVSDKSEGDVAPDKIP
jgi:hypothetical protein